MLIDQPYCNMMMDQYEYAKSLLTVKNDRVLVYEFIVEMAQHRVESSAP